MNFLDSTSEKIFSAIRKLKEKNKLSFVFLSHIIFQRWAIAIGLCAILTLLLTPKLYNAKPEYRHGMIAQENIKADRDFLVEDVNSTRQKRNEASASVRPVYDYDAEIAITLRTKIKKSFAVASSRQEDAYVKALLEKSLGRSITSGEYSFLKMNNFSDDLQQKLARVVTAFYENRLVSQDALNNNEREKVLRLLIV